MQPEAKLTGGRVNYYLVHITDPQREDQPAYQAECEDIIEALELNPDEANIFKEIWRSANARKHNGKPGHSALYGAEKIVHYAGRILRRLKRNPENATSSTDTTAGRSEAVGITAGETAQGIQNYSFQPGIKHISPFNDRGISQ